MKKPSLIIGKKQIILSCLTLMLAIAVYVNYAMSDGKLETAQVQSKDSVTYGDTAFVNAEAEQSEPAAVCFKRRQKIRLMCLIIVFEALDSRMDEIAQRQRAVRRERMQQRFKIQPAEQKQTLGGAADAERLPQHRDNAWTMDQIVDRIAGDQQRSGTDGQFV